MKLYGVHFIFNLEQRTVARLLHFFTWECSPTQLGGVEKDKIEPIIVTYNLLEWMGLKVVHSGIQKVKQALQRHVKSKHKKGSPSEREGDDGRGLQLQPFNAE